MIIEYSFNEKSNNSNNNQNIKKWEIKSSKKLMLHSSMI